MNIGFIILNFQCTCREILKSFFLPRYFIVDKNSSAAALMLATQPGVCMVFFVASVPLSRPLSFSGRKSKIDKSSWEIQQQRQLPRTKFLPPRILSSERLLLSKRGWFFELKSNRTNLYFFNWHSSSKVKLYNVKVNCIKYIFFKVLFFLSRYKGLFVDVNGGNTCK